MFFFRSTKLFSTAFASAPGWFIPRDVRTYTRNTPPAAATVPKASEQPARPAPVLSKLQTESKEKAVPTKDGAHAQSNESSDAVVKDFLVSMTPKIVSGRAAASNVRDEAAIPEATADMVAEAEEIESCDQTIDLTREGSESEPEDSELMRDLQNTVLSLKSKLRTLQKKVSDKKTPVKSAEKTPASKSADGKTSPAKEWTLLNAEDIDGKASITEEAIRKRSSLAAANDQASSKTATQPKTSTPAPSAVAEQKTASMARNETEAMAQKYGQSGAAVGNDAAKQSESITKPRSSMVLPVKERSTTEMPSKPAGNF